MASRNSDNLIRLGVLALPLAGLLALVGLYSSFQLGTGGILATGDNRAIVSGGYYVSQLLGNALALTLLIFGVMALYVYLANIWCKDYGLGCDGIEHLWDRFSTHRLGSFCLRYPRPQPIVPGG